MGVFIKAVVDGFRRGGIAHRAKGTYYPDGRFTEEQLEAFRKEPQLVVVEQDEPDDASGVSEQLLQEMGGTIAQLEHALEQARAGLKASALDLVTALEQQKAAPALIISAAKALEPADPAAEGVIRIAEDALLALISQHLQPVQVSPEAKDDASNSTVDNSGGSEASSNPAPPAPVSPKPGADADLVKDAKPNSKASKAASK